MKKVIAFILIMIMLAVPFSVSAEETAENLPPVMGDINLDGKISAADARRVLRMSASLESSEGVSLLSADADGNGKITAADARLVLRKAASLSEFTYGFSENGFANSLKAFLSDTYVMGVSVDDMSFDIMKKGDDIRIVGADMGDGFAQLGMEDCGIMYCGEKLYMTYKNKGKDVAMFISAEMYDTLGISLDDVTSLAYGITMFLPDDPGVPVKQEIDGKTAYVYDVENEGVKSKIITDSYGIIKSIDGYDDNGEYVDTVVITKVSAQVDASVFDLNNYEII